MKTSVTHNGRRVDGEHVRFEVEREAWNEYRLEDGTLVRVRVVVADIVVTEETNGNGEPLVVVQSQMLVSVVKPTDPVAHSKPPLVVM